MAEIPVVRRIIVEVLPFMFLSLLGEVFVGLTLESMKEFLQLIPGLIVLVPAVLDMRGCISCALASRLSTGIHLGVVGWKLGMNEDLRQNLGAALFLSFVTSLLLGIMAHFTSLLLGFKSAGVLALTLISILAGTTAGLFQVGLTTIIALYSALRGLDPDNVTIPALSTSGDLIGIFCLFLAAIIVQRLGLIVHL